MLWFANAWSERGEQQSSNQCQAFSLTETRKLMEKPGCLSLNSPLPPGVRALLIHPEGLPGRPAHCLSDLQHNQSWNPQRSLQSTPCYCWNSDEAADPSYWVGEKALCTWWSTNRKHHPFLPQFVFEEIQEGLRAPTSWILAPIVCRNPHWDHTTTHSAAHFRLLPCLNVYNQ